MRVPATTTADTAIRSNKAPWAVVAVLATASVLVLAYPVSRIGALPSLNYNEGWNAYRARSAAAMHPLYAHAPALWITNYPPLSFHLIGAIGSAVGDVVLAGRVTALASLIAMAALIGRLAGRMAGSARAGIIVGLCLLLWVATLTPERRAMDDPSLLAAAVASAGLLAASEPFDRRSLAASGAVFAISLFVKQDVIALPIAVGASLALGRRWNFLLVWSAAGAVTAIGLLALTMRIDGPWFLTQLLWPRAYSASHLGKNVGTFLLYFAAPIVASVVFLLRRAVMGERRFPLILLLVTGAVSIALAGGDGVALNIFYPSMIALALTLSAPWKNLEHAQEPVRRDRVRAAALVVPVLASLAPVPFAIAHDLRARRALPRAIADARTTIAILAASHGPAICEDLLLCFRAGKPIDADPFFVHDQIAIGRLDERAVLARIDHDAGTAIEIEGRVNRPRARRRFSAAFMRHLLATDRIVSATGNHTVLESKAGDPVPAPRASGRS